MSYILEPLAIYRPDNYPEPFTVYCSLFTVPIAIGNRLPFTPHGINEYTSTGSASFCACPFPFPPIANPATL